MVVSHLGFKSPNHQYKQPSKGNLKHVGRETRKPTILRVPYFEKHHGCYTNLE